MSERYVSVDDLVALIDGAEVEMDVLVESTDYYRRLGDHETSSITYLCPRKFRQGLTDLFGE